MQQYLLKCFTPNLPSVRCGTVCLGVRFIRAERGDPGGDAGVGVGWAVWSFLLLTGAKQEAVAPEMTSLSQVAFRLFTVEMHLDPWWNCLAGLWALYFENKSLFFPRYEWQVGIEAEPSKVCFVHQLSECVRLPPLTNGNKTDKSPYVVFDNNFESLMEAC